MCYEFAMHPVFYGIVAAVVLLVGGDRTLGHKRRKSILKCLVAAFPDSLRKVGNRVEGELDGIRVKVTPGSWSPRSLRIELGRGVPWLTQPIWVTGSEAAGDTNRRLGPSGVFDGLLSARPAHAPEMESPLALLNSALHALLNPWIARSMRLSHLPGGLKKVTFGATNVVLDLRRCFDGPSVIELLEGTAALIHKFERTGKRVQNQLAVNATSDPNPEYRRRCLELLLGTHDDCAETAEAANACLADEDEGIRLLAGGYLGKIDPIDGLQSDDPEIQQFSAGELAATGGLEAIVPLGRVLKRRRVDEKVRKRVEEAINAIKERHGEGEGRLALVDTADDEGALSLPAEEGALALEDEAE